MQDQRKIGSAFGQHPHHIRHYYSKAQDHKWQGCFLRVTAIRKLNEVQENHIGLRTPPTDGEVTPTEPSNTTSLACLNPTRCKPQARRLI